MTGRQLSQGFTLIELIVILVLLGIVGSFLITFMGDKITHAPDVVLTSQREAVTEQVMERIIADYLVQINGANPDGALAQLVTNNNASPSVYASLGAEVAMQYVTFDAGGNEVAGSATDPTLKITVTVNNGQSRLVTLLSKARTTAGAANEDPVNY